MPVSDIFYDAELDPTFEQVGVNESVKFTLMEVDIDAYTHEVGWPYDISDIMS